MSGVPGFTINADRAALQDLQERLAKTRWTPIGRESGWDAGTDPKYLKELVEYWEHRFSWDDQAAALNRFHHFKAEVNGVGIHYIHERGKGPNPLPIVLTHGYPDSFYRFVKLIPLLTDPEAFGGRAVDSFDVVVPDLPGYGFSDTARGASIFDVGDLWAELMTKQLGYERFGAHGGDWGGTVTEQLARSHSDSVIAIHMTDVPFWHLFQKPSDLSSAEAHMFEKNEQWMQKEGAYAMIQSTKPQSLSPGLNDSPAGLAAWLVEKFRAWSDCKGDVESRFTKDEILTQVMIYWLTQSIGSSFQPYYDFANAGALTWIKEGFKKWTGSSETPAAFALFPADIGHPPREWAERFFNVQRWTEMPRGGHFGAFEEPELVATDLREWFRQFREPNGELAPSWLHSASVL